MNIEIDLSLKEAEVVGEIAKNHRKIIDDWCKAYLAQLYEEGIDIKPGCFTLFEADVYLGDGKLYKKYWLEPRMD